MARETSHDRQCHPAEYGAERCDGSRACAHLLEVVLIVKIVVLHDAGDKLAPVDLPVAIKVKMRQINISQRILPFWKALRKDLLEVLDRDRAGAVDVNRLKVISQAVQLGARQMCSHRVAHRLFELVGIRIPAHKAVRAHASGRGSRRVSELGFDAKRSAWMNASRE